MKLQNKRTFNLKDLTHICEWNGITTIHKFKTYQDCIEAFGAAEICEEIRRKNGKKKTKLILIDKL
jgi:hypothetical protein